MSAHSISTDAEKRRRVIFDRALRLPEAERTAYVERETAADPALRASVFRLLAASRTDSAGVLDHPVHGRWPEATHEPPSSIGGWQVVRCLGKGGMGRVYLCREPRDGTLVALKLLNFDLQSRSFLERFENERMIQSRLRHPNVCSLVTAGTTEHGTPFIVMEHVEGDHIDVFCRRARASTRQCLGLLSQILAAVEYFHLQQIVHRDLKPSNILVTAAEKVKILDFGVARIVNHRPGMTGQGATSTARPFMTIRYASPEQLQQRVSGRSSDIYSLGVVFYELLTGQHPFASELAADRHRLVAAMAERLPIPPSRLPGTREIPESVDHIIMKALRFDPGKRYGSAGLFHEDVRACLESMRVSHR